MQHFKEWTLFLDRDGVINQRIPDAYINHWDDFRFCRGALAAIQEFNKLFKRIIVLTNQQGIGKGIMTSSQLEKLHLKMLEEIQSNGGRIDGIYYCGDLRSTTNNCRKPSPAMAQKAKTDFPDIDLTKSIMVGDSISDMQFGRNIGALTVHIPSKKEEAKLWDVHKKSIDYSFDSLNSFSLSLAQISKPELA